MGIECVIDSSSIISLCTCRLQSFLETSGWRFISPSEVYDEVVEEGLVEGHADAIAAKKLFDEGTIAVLEVKAGTPPDLSTDEKVVELAKERDAAVLSNDPKLGRMAVSAGLVALRSAGFFRFLAAKGLMKKNQFKESVRLLVRNKRLSEKNAKEYLAEGGLNGIR